MVELTTKYKASKKSNSLTFKSLHMICIKTLMHIKQYEIIFVSYRYPAAT